MTTLRTLGLWIPSFDLVSIEWVLTRTMESDGSDIAIGETEIIELEGAEEERGREVAAGIELRGWRSRKRSQWRIRHIGNGE